MDFLLFLKMSYLSCVLIRVLFWDFVAQHLTISHLKSMIPLCLNATDYYARASGADKISELGL